jgi:hypothetical protein
MKKNLTFLGVVLVLIIVFMASFSPVNAQPWPYTSCGNRLVVGAITDSGATSTVGKARVTNYSDCPVEVTLATYKMYYPWGSNGNLWLTTQTIFDYVTITVPPHSTVTESQLRAKMPPCLSQMDLYIGPVRDLRDPLPAGFHVFDYRVDQTKPVCEIPPVSQGCSPGYWKQSQHFDSYNVYSPNTKFSDAFGNNVFGNMTLAQVLSQGGGGIKALGRIMTAALLNTSSVLGYPYSPAQVVTAFNNATPETYGSVKATFEALQDPCPLN